MYKHHPSLVLGFHACEREIGEDILRGEKGFKASENDFDWLGHGMYFWENSPHRAESYAKELKKLEKNSKIQWLLAQSLILVIALIYWNHIH